MVHIHYLASHTLLCITSTYLASLISIANIPVLRNAPCFRPSVSWKLLDIYFVPKLLFSLRLEIHSSGLVEISYGRFFTQNFPTGNIHAILLRTYHKQC